MPEPHEELRDTEEWDTFYDDRMPEDQKRIMKDLLFEVQRIKGGMLQPTNTTVTHGSESLKQQQPHMKRIGTHLRSRII
jgi:hypothetical protein